MDFGSILNSESVDPTPPSRRISNSQTPVSATKSPIQNGSSLSGVKRPVSASFSEEPSPKKIMRKRPLEKPTWAQKWTEAWHRQFGGRNGTINIHKSSPTPRTPSNDGSFSAPSISNRASSQRPSSSSQPTQSAPPAPPSNPSRPEPTYLNIYPQDELSRVVADFIYSQAIAPGWLESQGDEWEVEIEAKVGTIIDKNTNDRLHLPVRHECALNDTGLYIAFRSSMTQSQHRKMNEHLNKAVQDSLPKKGTGQPPSGVRRQPIAYKHIYELDKFFQLDGKTYRELPPKLGSLVAQAKQKPRVRVTFEQKTNKVVAKIIKIRLADLHVYSPNTVFDWRISVSLEVRYDGEIASLIPAEDTGRARNGRWKDRMSYAHQGIRIDLTQVTMQRGDSSADESGKGGEGGEKELEHELELELPVGVLKEEAAKLPADGEGFKSLTRLFVDDIRMATRQFPMQ